MNGGLSKAQLAAKMAREEMLKSGGLENGAAARRRQLELERARAKRKRSAGGS